LKAGFFRFFAGERVREMKNGKKDRSFIPAGGALDKKIKDLLAGYESDANYGFARETAATVLKMLDEDVRRLDWKIISAAIKEMRHSFRVFAPYEGRRKVTIFGSARSEPQSQAYQAAKQFAERISKLGFMVITGAGHGIMQAANEGAGRENSFGLNIDLPWEQEANPVVEGDQKLINFRYFFTRKLEFLKESDALALFPGGFGTLDETFELLTLIQCGRNPVVPIVMIDVPELNYWTRWLRFMQSSQLKNGFISRDDLYLWSITYDVDEACRIITEFYRNYHSQRWVGDRLVLRIRRRLTEGEIEEIRRDFSGIVLDGSIEQQEALPEEAAENGGIEFPELPRLVFRFDRRSFGRLRRLIDRVNEFR
jgi:uncharacterized protein (TIGR00730 family)